MSAMTIMAFGNRCGWVRCDRCGMLWTFLHKNTRGIRSQVRKQLHWTTRGDRDYCHMCTVAFLDKPVERDR